MKERLMLMAGGIDRKGVVFELTSILKKFKFNIEDSSMIMLRRTFSMIMLLSTDVKYGKKQFLDDISAFMKKSGMTVDIKVISEKEMAEPAAKADIYSVTISGADKSGIVNGITEAIFSNGGNITGLETKSSEKVKPHAYYMFLEVEIPSKPGIKKLDSALKAAAAKYKVHFSMTKVDKEIL
jgi:glycine cleavage system transcriptional repressor